MKISAVDAIQMQAFTNLKWKDCLLMAHLDLYIFYRQKAIAFLPVKTSILFSRKETTDEDA